MAKRKTTPEPTSPESNGVEYQVLARRYRPRQFADLVGQEPVAQSLTNALSSGRVAHAYLFTGARGVGKTSMARILAKCLNCLKGPTTTPCDQCEMCQAIASGDDVDVLEIDGASNNGVDEVRELRVNAQYRPQRARYKVYIIDEVHMLSKAAFNALLKTLEEPPAHVKFIFATTESDKIPITILSRCQRFDFAGIRLTQIVERLRDIVKTEGRQADEDALTLVARRAAGSMRDAQSLLDQLLAFAPEGLTVGEVNRLLGSAGEERVAALAQALLQKDAALALDLVDQAIDQGAQLGELLDQLVEYWRDLLVTQVAGPERVGVSMSGERKKELEAQATQCSPETLLAGLDVLTSARQRLRLTGSGRALLEMAVVRLCRLDNLVALAQLTDLLGKPQEAPARAAPAKASQPPPTQPLSTEKKKELGVSEQVSHSRFQELTEENLSSFWQQVVEKSAFILQAQLKRVSSLAISGPNALVIRFPPGYNLHEENLLDPARVQQVERILEQVLGRPCSLRQDIDQATAPPAAEERGRRPHLKEIPLVGRAMEVLEARVVSEDPEFGVLPKTLTSETDEG